MREQFTRVRDAIKGLAKPFANNSPENVAARRKTIKTIAAGATAAPFIVSALAAEAQEEVISAVQGTEAPKPADAFADAARDPKYGEIFSRDGVRSADKGLTPIIMPMIDVPGEFRILALLDVKGVATAHDLLFFGNGLAPANPNYNRMIVTYEGGDLVLREQKGSGSAPAEEKARVRGTQPSGDSLVTAIDIRSNGTTGTFGLAGMPDEQRVGFAAAATFLGNGNKLASAAASEGGSSTTVNLKVQAKKG